MDSLEVLDRIQSMNITEVASQSVAECSELIVEKNRQQLLEGKLSTGQDITPTYFDDPYFKSRESAERYSNWKDKITPNPKRKKGTPNLFIIGTYHNSIELEVINNEMIYSSTFIKAQAIETKFSENIYGLTTENKEAVINEKLEDTFYEKAHQITGL